MSIISRTFKDKILSRSSKTNLLTMLILTIGALVVAFPFFWMLSTSLKDLKEVYLFPPVFIPEVLHWENFLAAWNSANFPRYFANSLFVAAVVSFGQIATSALAAYAFARMEFKGKNFLFLLVLGTMMIPSDVMLIPNYVILNWLGWVNSYPALIVPFLAGAFGIFILRQHFKTIPQDFEDAACIDGCSKFRFLLSIVIPMSKPALATVAIFTFINNWNAYIWPLIVTRDDHLRTIQVGLAAFKDAQTSGANTNWPLLLAASAITLVPVLIIYLFFQKWFTEGFVASGIKG